MAGDANRRPGQYTIRLVNMLRAGTCYPAEAVDRFLAQRRHAAAERRPAPALTGEQPAGSRLHQTAPEGLTFAHIAALLDSKTALPTGCMVDRVLLLLTKCARVVRLVSPTTTTSAVLRGCQTQLWRTVAFAPVMLDEHGAQVRGDPGAHAGNLAAVGVAAAVGPRHRLAEQPRQQRVAWSDGRTDTFPNDFNWPVPGQRTTGARLLADMLGTDAPQGSPGAELLAVLHAEEATVAEAGTGDEAAIVDLLAQISITDANFSDIMTTGLVRILRV